MIAKSNKEENIQDQYPSHNLYMRTVAAGVITVNRLGRTSDWKILVLGLRRLMMIRLVINAVGRGLWPRPFCLFNRP